MAYYGSYYQEDDYDEFNLYPQDGSFQFAQTLPSMASFGHENSIYTLFQYDPPLYYGDYDSATTFSAARCSASSFSQPLMIQYDPNLYDNQEDDYDEFNLYPQDDSFQFAQTLPSMASFGHENSIYTLLHYDPPRYYDDYDSATTFSAARCSASSFSQPLMIQYDPNLYDNDFNSNSTKFVVSYSVSEFGEPEFEEFNPTPYAGGYDPAQTYGKPLPASSEICHPRSHAGPVSDQVSNGFAALSKEKEKSFEQEVKPANEGEIQKGKIDKEEESKKTNDGGENGGNRVGVNEDENVKVPKISQISTGYALETIDEEEESEETSDGGENGEKREAVNEDENVKVPKISQIPTGYGLEDIDEEEESEETNDGGEKGENIEAVYRYENAKVPQISQIPSGYGLEAIDLCESLFGYWPCLSKMNRERDDRENGCREIHGNQWSMAADYLFGSSDPYAEMTDEGRCSANPICCHDRHYQLQSYYGSAENC